MRHSNNGSKPLLAAPLVALATQGEGVEKAATTLLAAIREGGIKGEEAFDEAIKAAFDANGWNTRPGKPREDRRAVPHTVRTYVWEIRAAFRVGVEVQKCKTMYEVRMLRQKASATAGPAAEREPPLEVPPEVEQDLAGVRVVAPKQPNGALFHDLIALFIVLPQQERATLGRQLSRLLHTYQKVAAPAPVQRQRATA